VGLTLFWLVAFALVGFQGYTPPQPLTGPSVAHALNPLTNPIPAAVAANLFAQGAIIYIWLGVLLLALLRSMPVPALRQWLTVAVLFIFMLFLYYPQLRPIPNLAWLGDFIHLVVRNTAGPFYTFVNFVVVGAILFRVIGQQGQPHPPPWFAAFAGALIVIAGVLGAFAFLFWSGFDSWLVRKPVHICFIGAPTHGPYLACPDIWTPTYWDVRFMAIAGTLGFALLPIAAVLSAPNPHLPVHIPPDPEPVQAWEKAAQLVENTLESATGGGFFMNVLAQPLRVALWPALLAVAAVCSLEASRATQRYLSLLTEQHRHLPACLNHSGVCTLGMWVDVDPRNWLWLGVVCISILTAACAIILVGALALPNFNTAVAIQVAIQWLEHLRNGIWLSIALYWSFALGLLGLTVLPRLWFSAYLPLTFAPPSIVAYTSFVLFLIGLIRLH
jgi:hypothetical protein